MDYSVSPTNNSGKQPGRGRAEVISKHGFTKD
jgi:hypothetical protein